LSTPRNRGAIALALLLSVAISAVVATVGDAAQPQNDEAQPQKPQLPQPALKKRPRTTDLNPARPAPVAAPAPKPVPFTANAVIEEAKRLSSAPYRAPPPVTPGLEDVTYDQYRDMRFRSEHAIWDKAGLPFRIDLLPAGFVFRAPVAIFIVENGMSTEMISQPEMFDFGPSVPAKLRTVPLSLSGFRVRTRINTRSYWDEFVVFQGASYFRAVGRGQAYGLSARGLALRTAEPEGEEFPAFTRFWIEKPARNAPGLVIHALLDSPSTTGAYRFFVTPGRETTMDVDFTLFPRVDLRNVGIAPLTSMFLFDGTNRTRFEDFRYRVHDSDGLLIQNANGERIWRPLANPRELQLSSFTATAPQGFGLVQRARMLADFQDLEANYEKRPSVWVEMKGELREGPLRLVEIPTRRETNDNIVAFWQPREVMPAGKPYTGAYRLHWTAESLIPSPLPRIVATSAGTSFDGQRKLFVLDVVGAGTTPANISFDVSGSAGKITHPLVQANPTINGLRATFELDPGNANVIELRALLRRNSKPASETWLYRWTPN
jgi:periplasmic glucans biosynthesis protein